MRSPGGSVDLNKAAELLHVGQFVVGVDHGLCLGKEEKDL